MQALKFALFGPQLCSFTLGVKYEYSFEIYIVDFFKAFSRMEFPRAAMNILMAS